MARRKTRKGIPKKHIQSSDDEKAENNRNNQETTRTPPDSPAKRVVADETLDGGINLEPSCSRQDVVTDPDPAVEGADNLDLGFSFGEESEEDVVTPLKPSRVVSAASNVGDDRGETGPDDILETPSKSDVWAHGKEAEMCRLWEAEPVLYDFSKSGHRDPSIRDRILRRFSVKLGIPCEYNYVSFGNEEIRHDI